MIASRVLGFAIVISSPIGWLGAAPVPVAVVNPSFETPELAIPPGTSFQSLKDAKALPGNWRAIPDTSGVTAGGWGNIPGASDGRQFFFGASSQYGGKDGKWKFRLWQSVGPVEENAEYSLAVDLRPNTGSKGDDPACVLITADAPEGAVLGGKFHRTPENPKAEDFKLIPGQWVSVSARFNSAEHPDLVGRMVRLVVGGEELLVDNVRFTKDTAKGANPPAPAAAAGASWISDLADGQRIARSSGRRILVLFANRSAEGPRYFEDKVVGAPQVSKVLGQRYVAVRLDLSEPENQRIAERLGIFRAGVASIYDSQGNFVRRLDRALPPSEMVRELDY